MRGKLRRLTGALALGLCLFYAAYAQLQQGSDLQPESSETQNDDLFVEEEDSPASEESLAVSGETEYISEDTSAAQDGETGTDDSVFSLEDISEYSGEPYEVVNENVPFFTDEEITTDAFETYSEMDSLGRCGVAYANVCQEIMPTESRGSIDSVNPTGWHTVEYDVVSGNYLYNRCHLIAYELAGENANEKNLITGTRYFNVEGMLPFENMVADYVKETDYHVLYRVTPVFEGNNLVASGALMEAMSVEEGDDGILFCVYCYNVQPGISIDYTTGDSWEIGEG